MSSGGDNQGLVCGDFTADTHTVGMSVEVLNGVKTPPGAVVIASSSEISAAIKRLAQSIAPWVLVSPESPVVVVALLEGGRFFADRLVDNLKMLGVLDISRVDLKVSTRNDVGVPLPKPSIKGDITALSGKRVLVVDDILDSGITIRLVRGELSELVSELRVAVLLKKDDPVVHGSTDNRPPVDFVGISFVDSRWFSGVGLDMPNDPQGLARQAPLLIAYPPLV